MGFSQTALALACGWENGQARIGVNKKLNFLVVGSIGNDQWLHSSYGTKIKKALELREAGAPIAIVSEDHWQSALFG